MDLVEEELSLVIALVFKAQQTFTVLASLAILALIILSIGPFFFAFSVLLIFEPVAFITSTVCMAIHTFSTGLVI